MSSNYNPLRELRQKKEQLRQEVEEQEKILKFDNVKQSLSVLTNGFTDRFLKDTPVKNNEGEIVDNKTTLNLNTSNIKESIVDNVIRFGVVTLITNYAQKKLHASSWKGKLLGVALVYVAPIVIRKVVKLLEEMQENKEIAEQDSEVKNTMI